VKVKEGSVAQKFISTYFRLQNFPATSLSKLSQAYFLFQLLTVEYEAWWHLLLLWPSLMFLFTSQ